MKKLLKRSLSLLFVLFIIIVAYHNVSKEILSEDLNYIDIFLDGIDENPNISQLEYEEQLELIKQVQSNVLDIAPVGKGIPRFQERRPKDLYELGEGLCFDRSFVMELIYTHLGFETRHVSLFENKSNTSTLSTYMDRDTRSHAISEIKTNKGWLIVDSNSKWIGLDVNDYPISVEGTTSDTKWKTCPESYLYEGHHHFVYGLYSRHGNFFKPYNVIPDYNLSEMLFNL